MAREASGWTIRPAWFSVDAERPYGSTTTQEGDDENSARARAVTRGGCGAGRIGVRRTEDEPEGLLLGARPEPAGHGRLGDEQPDLPRRQRRSGRDRRRDDAGRVPRLLGGRVGRHLQDGRHRRDPLLERHAAELPERLL